MQPPEGAQVDLGKAQVIDRVPKVIKELKFGVMYGDTLPGFLDRPAPLTSALPLGPMMILSAKVSSKSRTGNSLISNMIEPSSPTAPSTAVWVSRTKAEPVRLAAFLSRPATVISDT